MVSEILWRKKSLRFSRDFTTKVPAIYPVIATVLRGKNPHLHREKSRYLLYWAEEWPLKSLLNRKMIYDREYFHFTPSGYVTPSGLRPSGVTNTLQGVKWKLLPGRNIPFHVNVKRSIDGCWYACAYRWMLVCMCILMDVGMLVHIDGCWYACAYRWMLACMCISMDVGRHIVPIQNYGKPEKSG